MEEGGGPIGSTQSIQLQDISGRVAIFFAKLSVVICEDSGHRFFPFFFEVCVSAVLHSLQHLINYLKNM